MFITFEGAEGGGKTTQAKLLSNWLNDERLSHVLTKEPGTLISKECQQIRKLILDPANDVAPRAELFLYLADRAQHVEKIIAPALEKKQWVVSDRYLDSTKVYQCIGRGLDHKKINPMIEYASHGIMPDLTFIMDIPADIGVQRAKDSNTEFEGGDRMEREAMDFHEKLRAGFQALAHTHERYVTIDARGSIEDIHKQVKHVVSRIGKL